MSAAERMAYENERGKLLAQQEFKTPTFQRQRKNPSFRSLFPFDE